MSARPLPLILLGLALVLAGCTAQEAPGAGVPATSTPATTDGVAPGGVTGTPATDGTGATPPAAEPAAPRVEVAALSVDRGLVAPEERFQVTVGLRNLGNAEGAGTVSVLVDGAVVATDEWTLAADRGANLSFALSLEDEGIHTVAVTATGATVVARPVSVEVVPPGVFRLSDLKLSPSVLELGDIALVTVSVTNEGGTPASGTVRALVAGERLASQSVELAAGATTTVTMSVLPTVASLGASNAGGAIVPVLVTISSGTTEATGNLTVRAPSLQNLRGVADNGICNNYLGYKVEFDNDGDGIARGIVVTAITYEADGTEHSRYETDPVDVPAGQTGSIPVAPLIEQRCGYDDTYSLRLIITPRFGDALTFDAGTFVV